MLCVQERVLAGEGDTRQRDLTIPMFLSKGLEAMPWDADQHHPYRAGDSIGQELCGQAHPRP